MAEWLLQWGIWPGDKTGSDDLAQCHCSIFVCGRAADFGQYVPGTDREKNICPFLQVKYGIENIWQVIYNREETNVNK